jgi:hypothetical protein
MNVRRIVETAFYPLAFSASVGIALLIDHALQPAGPEPARPAGYLSRSSGGAISVTRSWISFLFGSGSRRISPSASRVVQA